MNIILTGMPGAGKSTIGVVLAKILNMDFCDTDILIQQDLKTTLQDIINGEGISYFLKKEEEIILKNNFENSVVATGGSVVLSSKAMEHLKKDGKVIYLKLSLKNVKKRINNIETRGIAFNEGETLEDLYNYRKGFYEKYSDITVSCDGFSIEENINNVVSEIKKEQ